MEVNNALNTQMQARFSMAQAKIGELNRGLRTHEDKKDLMKVAHQFEGMFLKQLISEMDKTVDRSNGLIEGGQAEEMFRNMMYDQVSEMAATRPGGLGFGLAESIYKQLEAQLPKDQQTQSKPTNERLPVSGGQSS